jgi:hypothetical protein
VLRGAVHSVHLSGPSHPEQEELESLGSWALVHGLATMINEGTIAPGMYGAPSARELITALLNSAHMEHKAGAQSAAKKRGK